MEKKTFGLTGNQLKLIAMVTMTLDHIGLQLFPQLPLLRLLGRLAMPIYAYMIAQGCRHTRSRKRYLLSILLMGVLCQAVYWFAMGSLYQCILITFSLSIGLIYLIDNARKQSGFLPWALAVLGLLTGWFLCQTLPRLLWGTDYRIDYDFWGVLLPVLIYFGADKWQSLGFCAFGLTLVSLHFGGIQWYSLLTLPILALYNGQRGKVNMKYLFYLYYPGHLAVIHLLSLLM